MDPEKVPKGYAVEVSSEASIEPTPRSGFGGFIDSFKPAVLPTNLSEEEFREYLSNRAPLKRDLKPWQVSLIAIGGAIGSGLFLGSGSSFATGGPAGVIIGFAVISVMILVSVLSLGELSVRYPVNGGFLQHISRFVDPSWSLAMGWNYQIGHLTGFPLEIISTSITLGYWQDHNGATDVSKAAWVALFYAVCIGTNLFGAKGFGYAEATLSLIKVTAVVGFVIFAVVVICGGYPGSFGPSVEYRHGLSGKYIGGHFWQNPGAFVSGAKGVFTVLVNAAFAFGGTEVTGLAAAETRSPSVSIPRACKQVFWRVVLFYLVSLSLIGCLVPYDDDRLGTTKDGRASPFMIAISNANVRALPSIMNVVICLAVLSVGNYSVFSGSRTIASLAAQGFAPRIFAYIDRQGRPLAGIGLVAVFGLLCFLAASDKHTVVFNWLMALSGLSAIFMWGSINLSHIRFRLAMRAHGRSLNDELQYKSPVGLPGSILGFLINLAIIGLQFWVALYPVGGEPSVKNFFSDYLSVPVVIACYIGARVFMWVKRGRKAWYVHFSEIDLDGGMQQDVELLKQLVVEERERVQSRGFWYRAYRFWC